MKLTSVDKNRERDHILLMGLGNPGERYRFTLHNLGFMVLNCIEQDLIDKRRKQKKGLYCVVEGRIEDKRVVLMYPETYMNRSGQAFWSILNTVAIEAGS